MRARVTVPYARYVLCKRRLPLTSKDWSQINRGQNCAVPGRVEPRRHGHSNTDRKDRTHCTLSYCKNLYSSFCTAFSAHRTLEILRPFFSLWATVTTGWHYPFHSDSSSYTTVFTNYSNYMTAHLSDGTARVRRNRALYWCEATTGGLMDAACVRFTRPVCPAMDVCMVQPHQSV